MRPVVGRLLSALLLAAPLACAAGAPLRNEDTRASHAESRRVMVETQIEARGIRNPGVLAALREVPRHELVPEAVRPYAYEDRPLPIGERQTISQPYIVALMTELAEIEPGDRVLEVGTGSGYQAAVLAAMGADVYTIEIIDSLGRRAREDLERLGYSSITFRIGDGYAGWEEAAPFAAIIVTAAPPRVPQPLIDQLAPSGHLVIPVGESYQSLIRITRTPRGVERETIAPVRFVPMTGEAQRPERQTPPDP